ncbi:MAG TPA: DUF6544 family protein [Chloroflexia bacterium]
MNMLTHPAQNSDAAAPASAGPRRRIPRVVLGAGAGLLLARLVRARLLARPAPFAAVAPPFVPPETQPLPADLPAPVARFYRLRYGDAVPVIHTAVLSGRGVMRLGGIPIPVRWRFLHEAERNFRAYFELTLAGIPVLRANEHYRDGHFRQELPFGVEQGEPKNDHSAALRMWAEWALWLPALLLADPAVRWLPVDDETALLAVPVGTTQEHLVVRFDAATGDLQYVEAMKYKHATDIRKTLWANAVWFGDRPWADFQREDTVYNVPIDTTLDARGPVPAPGVPAPVALPIEGTAAPAERGEESPLVTVSGAALPPAPPPDFAGANGA